MEESKKLYLLTTKGLGDFHVIATDPTQAEDFLLKVLNDQDYGFYDDRRIINIKLVDETPSFHVQKPFLSDKNRRLFIAFNYS